MKHKTTTAKTEAKNAIGMSREVLAGMQDINNVLTTSKRVKAVFHAHYVNMTEGECGIADLICSILKEREACFPLGIENTELRSVAIAAALYTDEIIEAVQARFTAGSIRYPIETIKAYLSCFMSKDTKTTKATIGRIHLSKNEDQPRPCCKPRCKWYLID